MISLFKRKSKIAVEEIPAQPIIPVEEHPASPQSFAPKAPVVAAAPVEEVTPQKEIPLQEEVYVKQAYVQEEAPVVESVMAVAPEIAAEEVPAATPTPVESRATIPSAPVDVPAFDWLQASSLLGDEPDAVAEDMAEIVRELIASADAQFQELRGKKCESERQAISALAHQLRGSLLNFGFSGVGTILYQVEKGEYAPREYLPLVARGQAAFVASQKILSERYPSLRLS